MFTSMLSVKLTCQMFTNTTSWLELALTLTVNTQFNKQANSCLKVLCIRIAIQSGNPVSGPPPESNFNHILAIIGVAFHLMDSIQHMVAKLLAIINVIN